MEYQVETLSKAMLMLLDILPFSQNEIDWTNNLYDEVTVSCLEETPDGDYQHKIYDKIQRGEKDNMSCDTARNLIMNRIKNMLNTVDI